MDKRKCSNIKKKYILISARYIKCNNLSKKIGKNNERNIPGII